MALINILTDGISTLFCYFGLAGCLIIGTTTLYAALAYRGKDQERFSTFNHFISELGEVGVSARAGFFNAGLMIGGFMMFLFLIGLGIFLHNFLGWLAVIAGVWTAVSIIFVGIYSMDNLQPHIKAANNYFWSGLATSVLFGLTILFQPISPLPVNRMVFILFLPTIVAYSSFLYLATHTADINSNSNSLDPASMTARPRFWLLPVFEWSVYFTSFVWLFGIALVILI